MKKNRRRIDDGIDIYRDAMRRYITQTMHRWDSGDWFHGLIVPALHPRRQLKIAEAVAENLIDTLDVGDFPDVVRNNKKVFPSYLAGKTHERSKAVTWMYEISDWRNDCAHPTTDDFSNRDADRALDTCARVLGLVDAVAENQVRSLLDDPQETVERAQKSEELARQELEQAQQEIARAQQEKEEAHQMRLAAQEERNQAQHERDEAAQKDEAAKREREEAQRERNEAQRKIDQARRETEVARQIHISVRKESEQMERERDEAKQKLEDEQAAHMKTERQLADEREKRKEVVKELEEVKQELETARSQPRSKPTSVSVTAKKVEEYRNKFKRTKSGNGWRHTTDVDGWLVTRWVGKSGGEYRACVFAPNRRFDNAEAAEWPLVNQHCNSEEDAFKHLCYLEERKRIDQLARRAIEYYVAQYSAPEGPYDEVPF